ncbi:MAG: hypothetical protein U0031_03420 [Thermomicrobiales bacterium]
MHVRAEALTLTLQFLPRLLAIPGFVVVFSGVRDATSRPDAQSAERGCDE